MMDTFRELAKVRLKKPTTSVQFSSVQFYFPQKQWTRKQDYNSISLQAQDRAYTEK